jgi:Holliday junction resolvase RusA-like endonuclease
MSTIKFTALGEPASKSNSRRLVMHGKVPRFIKSAKALSFLQAFQLQCPKVDPLLEEDLSISMTIYYSSRRPDLDESVVLDAMQNFIYKNDRQIKEKHIYWGLDRTNPRVEVEINAR